MAGWRAVVGAIVIGALLAGAVAAEVVPAGKGAPEIATGAWINSGPLSIQTLRGRVVLVDFWTYG
jgi:hypothetical protein